MGSEPSLRGNVWTGLIETTFLITQGFFASGNSPFVNNFFAFIDTSNITKKNLINFHPQKAKKKAIEAPLLFVDFYLSNKLCCVGDWYVGRLFKLSLVGAAIGEQC